LDLPLSALGSQLLMDVCFHHCSEKLLTKSEQAKFDYTEFFNIKN